MDRMTHPTEAVDAVAQALRNAASAGALGRDLPLWSDDMITAIALLDRITPLLIAAEREACAKVAEGIAAENEDMDFEDMAAGAAEVAAAIREMGKA